MDNKIREKSGKIFLALAVLALLLTSAVVGAGILLGRKNGTTSSGTADEIVKILETKEVVASVSDIDYVKYSEKIDEISASLDKLESVNFKNEQVKNKISEAKESFVKIKESGEYAKILSKIKSGENAVEELKKNENLKNLGEKLEDYQKKVDDFKTKYSGTGEDIQAVLDYNALEKASEDIKTELAKLQEGALSGVTSDEIAVFYDKIEELKEIVSE